MSTDLGYKTKKCLVKSGKDSMNREKNAVVLKLKISTTDIEKECTDFLGAHLLSQIDH